MARNTYTSKLITKCPVNDDYDHYVVVIVSAKKILAEDITAILLEFKGKEAYQEDLTEQLAIKFNSYVRLEGDHRGVFIVSEVDPTIQNGGTS